MSVRARVGGLVCLGALVLGACAAEQTQRPAWARAYPQHAQKAAESVLDVQVVREGEYLTMTNTSARSFGACTLWVNRQFALPIEGFVPGETMRLSLHEFRNEFGEAFRAGGFFAKEQPDVVVLTQIEVVRGETSEVVGLVTVKGEAAE